MSIVYILQTTMFFERIIGIKVVFIDLTIFCTCIKRIGYTICLLRTIQQCKLKNIYVYVLTTPTFEF